MQFNLSPSKWSTQTKMVVILHYQIILAAIFLLWYAPKATPIIGLVYLLFTPLVLMMWVHDTENDKKSLMEKQKRLDEAKNSL